MLRALTAAGLAALTIAACGSTGQASASNPSVPSSAGPAASPPNTTAAASTPSSPSTTTTSTAAAGGTAPPAFTPQEATDSFRGYVAQKFGGTVATGDSRGCVKRGSDGAFSCTAYVQGPNIDVIGTVNAAGGTMIPSARRATGNEIQAWFQQTGGTNF